MKVLTCKELLRDHDGVCPECGYVYQPKTDRFFAEDNGTKHRRRHACVVPEPREWLIDYPPGDIRVDRQSSRRLHKLVYKYARYLQRHEGYDFVQWAAFGAPPGNAWERDIHAWLLRPQENLAIGAASFCWRRWEDRSTGWHLNFVWIAKSWRRRGILSARWEGWKKVYGAFTIEGPWSDDMRAFLKVRGTPDPDQMKWLDPNYKSPLFQKIEADMKTIRDSNPG